MTCFIPGCGKATGAWPPACRAHWDALPETFRAAIRLAAPVHQDRPSDEYRFALERAAEWTGASTPVSGAADYAMALTRRMTGEREE